MISRSMSPTRYNKDHYRNTHFPTSDLNNIQSADQVSKFLSEKKLD